MAQSRTSPLSKFIRQFLRTESAGGLLMMLVSALAILIANSPFALQYQSFISTPIATEPLNAWVKDVLMVFFFLLIGLELKRELKEGFLAKRGQVMLPLCAALGGMAVPAALFAAFNYTSPGTLRGWAVPCATDIAFALALLSLFGKNIPPAVKIFLLAIAIFDDLGAILIIAAFYNTGLHLLPLLLAACGMAVLWGLNRMRVSHCIPYLLMGVFLWFFLHHGGIHTTLAGIAVGLAIPMRNSKHPHHFPVNRWIHVLHPWVSFMILPIFAFTNAGVNLHGLNMASLTSSLPLGIALGLFAGKQIGIFGASWLLIRGKRAVLPQGAGWLDIYAVSIIAGIGFTMSLFISLLAFTDATHQELAKLGVIAGSVLSMLWGAVVLKLITFKRAM